MMLSFYFMFAKFMSRFKSSAAIAIVHFVKQKSEKKEKRKFNGSDASKKQKQKKMK